MKYVTAYKLARPDGWDFFTGKSVLYRGERYPRTVRTPNPDASLGLCSSGVIHASKNPNDCFVGATIPCSAFKVTGTPVCGTPEKWGFLKLSVIEEITDLDALFGWRYSEAIDPIKPFALPLRQPTPDDIALLHQWASVGHSAGASVRDSVRDSAWDSVWASAWASVRDSVWASVWDSVWPSVRDSAWASVRDSVGAYIGYMFPQIKKWKYVPEQAGYPFQPAVDLWKRGLVPSFDGRTWRLHSGPKAAVVYEEIK